ncbi:hypothetical protein GOODEAATRI_029697 [Goodea atripinnis]|uniref:Uncharacterized protein n=1 Tax=Goodea atripinnis TaxID=208336 RepID=A0ABV0Q252_9TELE
MCYSSLLWSLKRGFNPMLRWKDNSTDLEIQWLLLILRFCYKLRSGFWLGHSNTLILCCCVWDYCPVDDPLWAKLEIGSNYRILWYTEDFIVNSDCKLSRCGGRYKNKKHQPSTTVLDSWYEVLVLMC